MTLDTDTLAQAYTIH